MQFNGQYNTKAALITAIGSLDYMEVTTDELYDGRNRTYVIVLPYDLVYAQRLDNKYRVIKAAGITTYGAND